MSQPEVLVLKDVSCVTPLPTEHLFPFKTQDHENGGRPLSSSMGALMEFMQGSTTVDVSIEVFLSFLRS